MKIRIISKRTVDGDWWYNSHIGEEFEVIRIEKDTWYGESVLVRKEGSDIAHQIYLENTNFKNIKRLKRAEKLNKLFR